MVGGSIPIVVVVGSASSGSPPICPYTLRVDEVRHVHRCEREAGHLGLHSCGECGFMWGWLTPRLSSPTASRRGE